ncbi:MAG: tannase/feruloyl esterase family alpha/beta hydrolase, partial [Pseudomonadota bacterium]
SPQSLTGMERLEKSLTTAPVHFVVIALALLWTLPTAGLLISSFRQPEALLDYAYRGVHLATIAAKGLIGTYYGRDIDYSYLSGCSNGGRAALMEVARFPTDYDGVIAGAPVYRFAEFIPWAISVARAMREAPLTTASLDVLARASKEGCDRLDGVADGVINDPRLCTSEHFDVANLECKGGNTDHCLSAGQVKTAQAIYAGVTDSDGKIIAPGVSPGAENAGDWAFWTLPNTQIPDGSDESLVAFMGNFLTSIMRHDPTFDLNAFDPATDTHKIERELVAMDPTDTDLSDFKDNGGKLIVYQGWHDFPLRPERAFEHLQAVQDSMGGAEAVDAFYRLFMVPGMTHCAGGPGAWQTDYVTPLVQWREQGKAPDRIVGKQPGGKTAFNHLAPSDGSAPQEAFTRPQCVYPKLAQYSGQGDTTDASNFVCR